MPEHEDFERAWLRKNVRERNAAAVEHERLHPPRLLKRAWRWLDRKIRGGSSGP